VKSAVTYDFGVSSGLSVRPGRVVAGAHGFVVVGVPRERQPVGDVEVGLERVVHVVVQPAAHAVHRVPGTVALAHQIVPQAVAADGRHLCRRGRLRGRSARRRDQQQQRDGGPPQRIVMTDDGRHRNVNANTVGIALTTARRRRSPRRGPARAVVSGDAGRPVALPPPRLAVRV